jgi:hypothetical protein
MAPNTKQLSRIVQHLSSSDLTLSKTTFAPLTQEIQNGEKSTTEENYWDWNNECKQQETDSYWEWPGSLEAQVLSTEHIVSHLVNFHVSKCELIQSKTDSCDYWDERTVKDREQSKPPIECGESSDDYWKWNEESQMNFPKVRTFHAPQQYWDWKHESDESDKYWDWSLRTDDSLLTKTIEKNLLNFCPRSGELMRSGIDSYDYWDARSLKDQESSCSQSVTEITSDDYWKWASSV